MSFWTDTKIIDDFSVMDKFVYLYLLTNPHTNLCGCYEISFRQMAYETGIDQSKVKETINRLKDKHDVIRYSDKTKEVLLINFYRYNWTSSEKFRKPLLAEINSLKDAEFKRYLSELADGKDTVSIPYSYGSDTTVTVSVPDTVSVPVSDSDNKSSSKKNKSYEKEFDEIWELYPKKQGKTKAKEKYIKARKEGTTKEEVENGIKNYVRYIEATRTEDQYIKHGSTYFNNRCWLDEYTIKSGKDALRAWAEGDSNGQKTDSNIIDVSAEFIS